MVIDRFSFCWIFAEAQAAKIVANRNRICCTEQNQKLRLWLRLRLANRNRNLGQSKALLWRVGRSWCEEYQSYTSKIHNINEIGIWECTHTKNVL